MLTPSLKIVMRNGKIFAFLMNMTCTFVSCFGLSFHKKTVGENRAHSLLQKEKREFAKSDVSKGIFSGIGKMVNPIFMSLNVFFILSWHFFLVVFHHKICVFIIFISFFDEVSNFRNRVFTSQKCEFRPSGAGGAGEASALPKFSDNVSFFSKNPLNVPFLKILNLK